MIDPIWQIMEHQGRTLEWLARRTGYSASHIRNVKSGGAPPIQVFQEKCALAMDLPIKVLFFSRDRTTDASINHNGTPAPTPEEVAR